MNEIQNSADRLLALLEEQRRCYERILSILDKPETSEHEQINRAQQ